MFSRKFPCSVYLLSGVIPVYCWISLKVPQLLGPSMGLGLSLDLLFAIRSQPGAKAHAQIISRPPHAHHIPFHNYENDVNYLNS